MTDVRFHPVSVDTFGPVFEWARSQSERIADATSPWDGGDSATAYYLSDDLLTGFAVKWHKGYLPPLTMHELRYVFSLIPGRGDALVEHAVTQGANALDCFDGYLPALYARHGFTESDREPNYDASGPDVVYMLRGV